MSSLDGTEEGVRSGRVHPNASRRREKPQLSCNLCRRRKLRCDRQQPCSSCASRGMTCTYAGNHAIPPSLSKPAAMHDRIVQLERLVMSLIPASAQIPGPTPSSGPTPSPPPGPSPAPPGLLSPAITTPAGPAISTTEATVPLDARSECGSMHVSASELRYVGGDHWAAILDGIADLKDHFDREERLRLAQNYDDIFNDNITADPSPTSRALLLYSCPVPASRDEILAALPPKSAVDRYISRYFNRLDLVHSIIHGPSFLQEYEAFWTDPPSSSVLWIGLLFSMICLALLSSDPSDTAHGDPEHRSLQVNTYRENIVKCLVMGEYTKSGPHVLETVVHYVYIELILRDDADKDIWFLFGLEVNLAMRMGYHRDPSHFPGISPLQSEMRRRLWATVLQGDILVCSQMGMPRMISDWKCDTAEPRNFSDDDLNENTVSLPAARPETELTPALGLIARRRMFVALGAVSDLTSAIQPCTYTEVMRVDSILHKAAATLPPPLKPKPISSSVTDTPEVIMSRLFLAHLFHNGQILLHRRFLFLAPPSPTTTTTNNNDDDPYTYSRTTCLDASLAVLDIQNTLDEETRPGGQLYMMRWRVSSIMNHTFLTATTVLCSMVHRGQTLGREGEILTALRRARSIWMRASGAGSKEARKAAEMVSIVVARAGEGTQGGGGGGGGSGVGGDGGQGQGLLQDTVSFGSTVFDSDGFIVSGFMDAFSPPCTGSQGNTLNTGLELDDTGMALEEWMQMDKELGTN